MLATSSCSDDRGGHELAVRAGHVACREGVLIKEGQMSKTTICSHSAPLLWSSLAWQDGQSPIRKPVLPARRSILSQ